jgi:hypothetical protein
MSKELIIKAKELGIENAEALTASQLKKAIEKAESIIADENAVIAKATSLDLETEGKTIAELNEAIEETEALAAEIHLNARNTEIIAYLAEYLGVDDIDSLTKEEVQQLIAEKEAAKETETEEEVEVVQEGKTDEAYKASNGKKYVFTEDAPARFRYLGVLKTQKEWIADKDSIELMVAGNLSFLTLKK